MTYCGRNCSPCIHCEMTYTETHPAQAHAPMTPEENARALADLLAYRERIHVGHTHVEITTHPDHYSPLEEA